MQDLNHKHIIITAAIKKPLNEASEVEDWLRRVVDAVDMKILIEPKAIKCDTKGNEGVTGIVCIETSHASIHIWSECDVPFLKFDLYSCKDFDTHVFVDLIKEFDPYWYDWIVIDRNNSPKVIEKHYEQVVSIVSLLNDEDKEIYTSSKRVEARKRGMTKEEKRVNSLYNTLARKYGRSDYIRKYKYRKEHNWTISSIKYRSAKKGLDFDLTTDWYEREFAKSIKIWPKLHKHNSESSFWGADVDRIDPTMGYIQDNCRIVPRGLNVAKWNWSKNHLQDLVELLQWEIDQQGR